MPDQIVLLSFIASVEFVFNYYDFILILVTQQFIQLVSAPRERAHGLEYRKWALTDLNHFQDAFGDLALFFCDPHGGTVIAVLWKPKAFVPIGFKVRPRLCPLSKIMNVGKEIVNVKGLIGLSDVMFSVSLHGRRRRCLRGKWRWMGSKRIPFPTSRPYWRTLGSWERAWSSLWTPGLKNGHFRHSISLKDGTMKKLIFRFLSALLSVNVVKEELDVFLSKAMANKILCTLDLNVSLDCLAASGWGFN